MMLRTLFLLLTLSFSSLSYASYYGVLDNAEILKTGEYKLTGDVQALTDDGGINLGARADMGWNEDYGLRAILGFGKTDFYLGGMFRWIPIPDVENQPAIGVNMGFIYAKDGDVTDLTFRAEPLLSKKINIEQTVWTPYVSLPIGMRLRDTDNRNINDDTVTPIQLAIGSQLQVEKWKKLQFMLELGFDLNKAPGYVSAGAVFYFDRENGMVLE